MSLQNMKASSWEVRRLRYEAISPARGKGKLHRILWARLIALGRPVTGYGWH